MMNKFCVYLAVFFLNSTPILAEDVKPYHFVKEIPIQTTEIGWDYLVIDGAARRLYLSQLKRVVIVDLSQDKVSGEITDTPGVHGIALASEKNLGFTSNGKEGKISVVDLTTLKTLDKMVAGENPDAILYNSAADELYAFNGKSKSVSILSPSAKKTLLTLALPGKPEFAGIDPKIHRIYVNIEDKNIVCAIDSQKHEIVGQWSLQGCDEPTGLAIDLQRHRVFVGCHSEKLLMLDEETGKVLATIPIGKGVDAVAFDSGSNLVMSSNGEGTVTIAQEDSGSGLKVVQTLKTEKGARTMALDAQTRRIYLPVAQRETEKSGEKPGFVPGSFKLLVYGIE